MRNRNRPGFFNGIARRFSLVEAGPKRRLADEYDAAQERGEVAKIGDNLPSVTKQNSKPTAADIGLSRKEIHEARQIRDAEVRDPGIVRRTVDAAILVIIALGSSIGDLAATIAWLWKV